MERLREKVFKQENSFTLVLRTLIKQKEEIANKYKHENQELHKLLLKQQNLLNKLNEDNMNLNKSNNELKIKSSSTTTTTNNTSCCSSSNHRHQQSLNETE